MKDNRAARIKIRKEVYCETCGSNQPMVEHQPMKDAMNRYPWYDIACGTCYSIIAKVQIVPEDKPLEPPRAVGYRPGLIEIVEIIVPIRFRKLRHRPQRLFPYILS